MGAVCAAGTSEVFDMKLHLGDIAELDVFKKGAHFWAIGLVIRSSMFPFGMSMGIGGITMSNAGWVGSLGRLVVRGQWRSQY